MTALIGLVALLSSYFTGEVLFASGGFLALFPVVAYLFLYQFKWLYYLMIFVLPLSIHLDNVGLGVGLSLPGEVLLILVLIGVVWRVIFRFESYRSILFHPVSLVILAHVGWMLISTLTSVLVSVSIKFVVLRAIYLLVFYVYGAKLFLESGRLQRFVTMYALGFLPVIFFTLGNHYLADMSYEHANRTCYPFFNDHTIYAACIAMILPVLFALLRKGTSKWINLGFIIVMSVALYFSYSRAGLISVSVGFVLFLLMYFRIKLKWYFVSLALVSVLGFSFLYYKNPFIKKENTIERSDLGAMVSSVTDTGNYSNTERLNRWKSAYLMFKERPLTGFGPGTFMFVYGRYQEDKTFVSVSDASMGGAHSEYLKPLSEQGLLGLLFVFVIMGSVFFKGQKLSMVVEGSHRLVIIACVVGLATYYIHGMFNFFLDTDKASVLFWGLIAYIVAFDIRRGEDKEVIS